MIRWTQPFPAGVRLKALTVHSERARKPSDPECLYEFSSFLDRTPKIVLSHSLKETEWENSRIMKGDLTGIVTRLKREPGKDIIVDGGPSVVQEFMQRGLADDYRMMVWPVILGTWKTRVGLNVETTDPEAIVHQESQT